MIYKRFSTSPVHHRGVGAPSLIRILPPSNLLDLLDRIYARSGKRSGTFDVLAWADESVLFAEAKHGGKDALCPSQKARIEAVLGEGVPLGSLLVMEWGFRQRCREDDRQRWHGGCR